MKIEDIKEVDKVELPYRWHYNTDKFRMEMVVDVRGLEDEYIGQTSVPLTPRDIKDYIYYEFINKDKSHPDTGGES